MRHQIIGLAFCIGTLAMSAVAQNTFPATGNVGIGTTNPPAYPLDVNGAGHVSGNMNVDGYILPSVPNATLNIYTFPLNNNGQPNTGQTLIGSPTGGIGLYGKYLYLEPTSLAEVNNGQNSTGSAVLQIKTYTSGDPNIWFSLDNSPAKAIAGWSRSGSYWYLSTIPYTAQLVVNSSGNVGIGTTAPGASDPIPANGKLEVNGDIVLTNLAHGGGSGSIVFADGSIQTSAYTGITCTGADYAEAVDVTGDRTKYEPGDILVIDPSAPGKFLRSNQAYSTLVAGIYSTKPGFVGRKQPPTPKSSATEVPMAMVGRVPTKVTAENGSIQVGDLLVTSSARGYAMKGTDRSRMFGAVVGNALGSLDSGTGMIEVLVTLQ